MGQQCLHIWFIAQGERFAILCDSFRMRPLAVKRVAQNVTCILKIRLEHQGVLQLCYCFVITSGENENRAYVRADDRRKRVEFFRAFDLGNSLIKSLHVREDVKRKPLMSGRIIRIELDSATEFLLAARSVKLKIEEIFSE